LFTAGEKNERFLLLSGGGKLPAICFHNFKLRPIGSGKAQRPKIGILRTTCLSLEMVLKFPGMSVNKMTMQNGLFMKSHVMKYICIHQLGNHVADES
jgi:hypothetical protein